MRILFVMDPIEKCHPVWDNSLYLAGEFQKRGHENWTADSSDLWLQGTLGFGKARRIEMTPTSRKIGRRYATFKAVETREWDLHGFDLVLIRKDPPFDSAYFYLTHLLDHVADQVPVINHPTGIRNLNEKLAILSFPEWIPETLVANAPEALAAFQKKLRRTIVIKPLDNKAGKGVFLLRDSGKRQITQLRRATANGKRTVMAQEYVGIEKSPEKRIVVLNGEILCVYEKRARKNEFRANLSLGATFHRCGITARERKMVAAMKSKLLNQGIYFAGLDTRNEKLIEINVTSPAGVLEAKFLNPKTDPVKAWADFLERQAGC